MASDIGKSRREDSRILGDLRHDASLRVRMRRQTARTRADFAQFSEMSDNRETGWWEGSGFELSVDFMIH
jgi:hypothetical protein